MFGSFAVFNICGDSVPFEDFAVLITQRHAANQEPAILSVSCATDTYFVLERLPTGNGGLPLLDVAFQVV